MKLSVMKFLDKMLLLTFFFFKKKTLLVAIPKKILVIKLSAMGDAVCLMPAIRQLHEGFDDVQIDWFTSRRSVPSFFSGIPFIKRVFIMPTSPIKLSFFFSGMFSVF